MKNNFIISALVGIIVLIISCTNLLEQQNKKLLPTNYKLHLIKHIERGITNTYQYKINKLIDTTLINEFPIDACKEDKYMVVNWHVINDKEIEDVFVFFSEEQRMNDIANIIKNQLLKDVFFIAFIYDEDNVPIGKSGYSVYDWMDMYLLNINRNELTHFSYGKF